MATDKKSSSSSKTDSAANSDNERYKYHQSQINEDKDENSKYPDKPKNHTTTEERLLDTERGND